MTTTDDKLVQYLTEAHAMELALVRTLQAHVAMTPSGGYRGELERHLRETRGHAERIARRLDELGHSRSTAKAALVTGQRMLGQLLAFGKAPADMLRGASREEKLLKNAKDECATEQYEIATYDALEALAEAAGDAETARLAREHRADEERMLGALREALPTLTRRVLRSEVEGRPSFDVGRTGAAQAAKGAVEGAVGGAKERAGGAADAAAARVEEAAEQREPFAGYDELNADKVVRRLAGLPPARLRHVEAYERAHKRRRTVIEASERRRAAKSGGR
jgi:ferritin-like metal-binding protein YciE